MLRCNRHKRIIHMIHVGISCMHKVKRDISRTKFPAQNERITMQHQVKVGQSRLA